jgi:hypothetical protein
VDDMKKGRFWGTHLGCAGLGWTLCAQMIIKRCVRLEVGRKHYSKYECKLSMLLVSNCGRSAKVGFSGQAAFCWAGKASTSRIFLRVEKGIFWQKNTAQNNVRAGA